MAAMPAISDAGDELLAISLSVGKHCRAIRGTDIGSTAAIRCKSFANLRVRRGYRAVRIQLKKDFLW